MRNKNSILPILLLSSGLLTERPGTFPSHSISRGHTVTGYSFREVPILCYHNITANTEKENVYRISALHFEQQIKVLKDSGYHSIIPAQLYDHIKNGTPLPVKPVMFTFDDTHETHFSIASKVLEKYGYNGVFFIMTVCIGKRNYLKTEQIRVMADKGHAIEGHTYDHPSVKNMQGKWEQQVDEPKKKLEAITGKPVDFFAYPFGIWNEQAIIELKKRGVKAAFQLTGKKSLQDPLYTIKRMMVPGTWSGKVLLKQMTAGFHQ